MWFQGKRLENSTGFLGSTALRNCTEHSAHAAVRVASFHCLAARVKQPDDRVLGRKLRGH